MVHRIDTGLWRLCIDIVDDALWAYPEIWRSLETIAERSQHIVGNIPLGQPYALGAGPVHIDFELWHVKQLMDMGINRTGNGSYPLQKFTCHCVIANHVLAGQLDINWG